MTCHELYKQKFTSDVRTQDPWFGPQHQTKANLPCTTYLRTLYHTHSKSFQLHNALLMELGVGLLESAVVF